MSAAGANQSVFDYLDRKPIQQPSGLLQPREFQGDIEFNNVSLVYPARTDEIAIQVCWLRSSLSRKSFSSV
jgi:ABC-type multidrug transport system fused ATPase/permease subunit